MHGMRVLIQIDRKRYRRKVCGKTGYKLIRAMDTKWLAITRYAPVADSSGGQ